MKPNLVTYECPSCGISHTIKMRHDQKKEEYDGLCPECEEEWVESYEYQGILNRL